MAMNTDDLYQKACQHWEAGERRETGLLLHRILTESPNHAGAWQLFHTFMGTAEPFDDFKARMAADYYPAATESPADGSSAQPSESKTDLEDTQPTPSQQGRQLISRVKTAVEDGARSARTALQDAQLGERSSQAVSAAKKTGQTAISAASTHIQNVHLDERAAHALETGKNASKAALESAKQRYEQSRRDYQPIPIDFSRLFSWWWTSVQSGAFALSAILAGEFALLIILGAGAFGGGILSHSTGGGGFWLVILFIIGAIAVIAALASFAGPLILGIFYLLAIIGGILGGVGGAIVAAIAALVYVVANAFLPEFRDPITVIVSVIAGVLCFHIFWSETGFLNADLSDNFIAVIINIINYLAAAFLGLLVGTGFVNSSYGEAVPISGPPVDGDGINIDAGQILDAIKKPWGFLNRFTDFVDDSYQDARRKDFEDNFKS